MWRLRKARDSSVEAILPGYTEVSEGAAKGPRGKGRHIKVDVDKAFTRVC